MIAALLGGFVELAKKPALLLPGLFSAAFVVIILMLSQATIQGFLLDLVLNEATPQADFSQLPFLLYNMYANEINLILLLAFAFGIASNWLAFCFARFAKERKGAFEAMGFATANIVKAFYLTVFDALVFGFLFALFWVVIAVSASADWLGLILGIVVAIIALLVFLILLFLPTALAVEETSVKEALKKSSGFVKKSVLSAIVFFLVVGLIYSLVSNIGANLSDSLSDETVAAVVEFVFLLVAISYAGIAVPLYYLNISNKEK